MDIIEANKLEFDRIFFNPFYKYGLSEFNELNKSKCKNIYYLLFKDSKYRLGIIGGIKENVFFSPFSAPFGSFLHLTGKVRVEHIDSAVKCLKEWAKEKNLREINMTLPPTFYNTCFISSQINSFYRNSFTISNVELNYFFRTLKMNENYNNDIWKNARNNLNRAFKSNLRFHLCENMTENKEAYEIIEYHKKIKGYPLKLSWEQICDTIKIIKADFFLVYEMNNTPIASAIVFHTAESIVQIIYWGELPEFNHYRTMNFLSYKIFEYYKDKGIRIIDLGPSSENSVPNPGLCDFKESIGSGQTHLKKCDFCMKLLRGACFPHNSSLCLNI
jgi:hypothetical protein